MGTVFRSSLTFDYLQSFLFCLFLCDSLISCHRPIFDFIYPHPHPSFTDSGGHEGVTGTGRKTPEHLTVPSPEGRALHPAMVA